VYIDKHKHPNGLRYLLVGGRGQGLGAGFRLGVGKNPKMPQDPASQVHALLGVWGLKIPAQKTET